MCFKRIYLSVLPSEAQTALASILMLKYCTLLPDWPLCHFKMRVDIENAAQLSYNSSDPET